MLGPLANLVVNILVNTGRFNAQMANVHGSLNKLAVLGKAFGNFFVLTGAILALRELIDQLGKIETGFTRIKRVSADFRGPKFETEAFGLAKDISGTSIDDMQKILKISAQLGIRGKENLMEFSRQMAMLSNITGLSADTITTDIGKVVQVFNLLPKDVDRVSNSILQVADDFNVVETEITNIVRRIGAFSNSIGLSYHETIAFAGAMKDVGVNTEIAASSLYTFFARLQTEPVAIGKFFGLTNEKLEEFFILLRQKPAEAIIKLLEKIKDMPPSERLAFFEQLELYGVRNAAALGTLAEKLERLKEALTSAKKGAEDNVRALQGQVDVSNTLRGKIDDLTDAWKEFLVEFGRTGLIKGVFSFLSDSISAITTQLREVRGLRTDTDVDTTDPASLRKRINELDKIIATKVKAREPFRTDNPGEQGTFGLEEKFGLIGESYRKFWTDVTGFQRQVKERDALMKIYKALTETAESIPGKDAPSIGSIHDEFLKILAREDDKKKKGKGDQFKGFMGLTEAWKNLILDELDDKDKEFKTLKDIHNAEVEGNDHLASINDNIKNLRMGAILG